MIHIYSAIIYTLFLQMSPEPKLKFFNLICSFWGLVNAVCQPLQMQRMRNESCHEARKYSNRTYIIDGLL